MKNDAVVGGRRISIPPTLLASTIALLDDVRRAVTLEASEPGTVLVLVGETRDELGATEWAAHRGEAGGEVPRCRPADFWPRYLAVGGVLRDGLVAAAHAVGRGGLLPALFRMARAAGLGLRADLDLAPRAGGPGWEALLFGESCGRMLLACRASDAPEVLRRIGPAAARIGIFDASGRLHVEVGRRPIVEAAVADLASAWKGEGAAP
jgi:phosphoribosylformylglycinamidine synthase